MLRYNLYYKENYIQTNLSLRPVSEGVTDLSCLARLNRTPVSLGRCEYSNRTRVRTKQPYRDPAEEVVSVWFQTNSGTVEWMNQ